MFGFFKKRNQEQHALHDIFSKMSDVLSNDDLQNRLSGPQMYSYLKALPAYDARPNAGHEGPLGEVRLNPIPANGPIGSLVYLSSLRHSSGSRITFHRVQSIERVDMYEYVTLDGLHWGWLFVDMYHFRKSKPTPDGFTKLPPPQQLTGFYHYWDDFPFGYALQKEALQSDLGLLYCSIQLVSEQMKGRDFTPPYSHAFQKSILGEI